MSRTTKRFLSILLAAALILSLGITGWAIDDISIVDPTAEQPVREKDERVTEGFEGGTELELEEIDPSELNIPKLGEIDEETEEVEEPEHNDDDIVRVSISLEQPSVLKVGYSTQGIGHNGGAIAYRDLLKSQQADVEAKISAEGIPMNVKWNLTLAVNIISAEVRYGDIEAIEAVPGVNKVWLETQYEPQVDDVNTVVTTEHMVGATEVWSSGYTGAGTKVAIIDTGTNQDHLSFDPDALLFALDEDGLDPDLMTWDDIRAVADQLNVSVTERVYKNAKIPYAYNYVDGGYTTDHSSDSQGEHGSHVSGIAAANRYVNIDGEYVEAAQAVWAVGVAPDAQILTMKVFGAGGGAYDSDYMAAIEDAIILGADSVNLSLGSAAPGFTFSEGYQDVMDSLTKSDTVVSISAGNSYNWADFLPSGIPYLYLDDVSLHTGGSPGSFVNSLCVAAAQNVGTIAAPLIFNDDYAIVYTETTGEYSNSPISSIAGTYEYVLVNGPGIVPLTDEDDDTGETAIGTENDAFAALGREVLAGKVVMCYRGSSSFFVKANAAIAQGAAAVIIINNQDGVIRMNLTGYTGRQPVVSILKEDGAVILDASEEQTDANGNVYYTGRVEITAEPEVLITTARDDATITEFSSWGVPGSLIMKPEITAPGGDIYSVNGMTDDGYEYMSGTSMAAPHITGMAALLGQYVRENELEEKTGESARTLINSLLMSTASPMIVDGAYLSILQQGSGLGDTFAATLAKSYIMMGEDATESWADGKVKVELGQDAAREGVYSFSFSVNNFSDVDMSYVLLTHMFTQTPTMYQGNFYMLTDTMFLGGDYDESYAFERIVPNLHDVDKDGDTDRDDAQALLDYLTGNAAAEDLDLEAGEMDGTEGISSYDAQLLLEWLDDQDADVLFVPAGESVPVTVTITLSDDLKEFFDAYYTGGAWVEGFTYVIPITETDDGEELGVQHSIPILGFYGSFTDASMFDCVSAIDTAYGTLKESYTGNDETNYLTVNYGAKNSIFMGNPYTVEDEFPADRLAINSDTDLVNIKYNLIRNAASVGWLAYDEDGELLDNGNFATNVNSAYYHVNKGVWMDTGIRTAILNTSAGKLGLNEGDTFTIGLFAVPEYYGMQLHPGENDATVTPDEILSLRDSGELGAGSFLGYTFLVDNENPKITEVRLSDDKTEVAITAQDDNYVAFIAIADLLGNVIYVGTVPEQDAPGEEVTVTFDISDLGLDGAVAAFVGDYAANEDASLIRLSGEGTVPVTVTETHEIYKPATSIENGRDYLIVSTSNTGTVQAMKSNGAQSYVSNQAHRVKEGTLGDYTGKYIEVDSVTDSIRWIASTEANGFSLMCLGNGTYLGATANGKQPGCFDDTEPYNYVSNQLACLNYYTVNVYITWNGRNNFVVNYPNKPRTVLYIYVRDEYTETYVVDVDPENASEVTVNPDDLLMIVGETAKLRATVSPMVLSDKSVTWRSEDENVATVDANGVVTAVGAGETEIVATSKVTPTVSGSAHVKVLAPEPMDAVIYGQLAFGDDDVQFASIDLNDMSTENLSGDNVFSYFYGGAQSGDYIYGNDIDNDFHSYSGEDYTYDSFWHDVWEVINANFALLDGASIPNFTYLNMDDLDDDGNPAEVEFTTNVVGFCPAGYLLFYDEGGMDTLSGYGLSDYGNFVAITFAGLEQNDDGTLSFYYYGLSDAGDLWIFLVDAEIADGEADYGLRLGNLGPIVGLDMSKDKTAYSMAYAGGVLEEEGVFIADNTIGGIYYVPVDFDADEQELHFVGRIDGVTNLSTLFDNDYDAIGDLGAIKISTNSGDSVGDEYRASVFAREFLMDREVLAIERINPFDEIEEILDPDQDYEIVDLDPIDEVIDTEIDDGDVIEISGGLNAVGARTVVETRKTLSKLDSGALINPEYNDDGYTIIAMTTPNFGQEDTSYDVDYYNGFLTLNYDPVFLEYQSVEIVADVTLTSYSVDTQNGVIKLAYASLTPIEGEAVIANVQFSAPSDDTVVTVTTTEANDDLSVEEVTEIELEGPGYIVTVMDYTKLGATIDLDTEILHKGETTFTVEADQAVAVIVKDGPFTRNAVDWDEEDYRYTTIDCVDENGAHTFTIDVKQNLTICLVYKGDVSLNGVVETKDGTMIKRAAVGTYDLTDPLMRLVADVDNDGKIQTKDGQQVARAVVGTWEIPW